MSRILTCIGRLVGIKSSLEKGAFGKASDGIFLGVSDGVFHALLFMCNEGEPSSKLPAAQPLGKLGFVPQSGDVG